MNQPDFKNNPNWFIDQLTLYQNANSSPEAIKRNFLVRLAEFDLMISDLRAKQKTDPAQHELILGRRGSGKSTLLRRIQIEIDEQPDLSAKYIAINLAEEQNAIYRLSDLWFEVLEALQDQLGITLELRDFDHFDDNQAYTRYLYGEIHRLLQTDGRRVVLLLDNLDRILENFGDDGNLLRETLINYQDIQIIGGSTRMTEHFWRYDLPFYDFFRRHRLAGLTFDEIHQLLNHWAAEMEITQLHNYALRHRGRVEALRILTDGLPRALQYFIQVLLHDSELYGFDYLKKVMDNATPLYQERLNNLTAPQRKIVQEIAFVWEAAPTKTLVEKCRMESKLIASYLKQLERFGIVEIVPTDKKNHLYRLSERFFNMWLIVTQGNPGQKRRAKYLTLFLEGWYDENDLRDVADQHLLKLKDQQLSFDKAMVLSKGLSQSRYLTIKQRDELIDLTVALEPEAAYAKELPRKFSEIYEEAKKLVESGAFKKAIEVIDEIENEADGIKFSMQAYCYEEMNDTKKAEKYYLLAVEKGEVGATNNLGVFYKIKNNFEYSEKYYLMAVEKGHVDAMYNLANLYKNQNKFEQSEKYYLMAIGHGHVAAISNLAGLYKSKNMFKMSEKYYLMAVEKRYAEAEFNLANFYREQNNFEASEKYYLMAVEKGNLRGMNNLANLYVFLKEFKLAETYYQMAVDENHVTSMYNLANLYKDQGNLDFSEKYYLMAAEKGFVEAMYNLAILYQSQSNLDFSEKYYLMATEKGHLLAMNNLAWLYYQNDTQKQQALAYLKEYLERSQDTARSLWLVIFEIWNGIFDQVQEKVEWVIKNNQDEDLSGFINELLRHGQQQLVLSLFESPLHGPALRARYELLYYATCILTGRTEDNLLLRIPPEVMPTVEEIIRVVKSEE